MVAFAITMPTFVRSAVSVWEPAAV